MKMETKLDIPMDTNLEVKPPPRREDASLEGHTIEEATAEAQDRERRAEEATQWVNAQHAAGRLPHGLGDGEPWEAMGEGEGRNKE